MFVWEEDKILGIGSNRRCRKHKESAHTDLSTNPVNQSCLDISPISIPFINKNNQI
jgi:hypothetical protein